MPVAMVFVVRHLIMERNDKMAMDDRRYINDLIRQGEHQQQDFKYKITDAVKLARSVSAFANTDGGRLLIGVRDDGHVSGVRSEEEIYMMHAAAYRYCRPEASIKFDTYHVEGRTVVVATVPPSEKKPVSAIDEEGRATAYIRIDDENIVASPVHMQMMREEVSPQGTYITYTDAEAELIHQMEQTPRQPLSQILRHSKLSRKKVIVILARLIRYDVAMWELEDHRFLYSLK